MKRGDSFWLPFRDGRVKVRVIEIDRSRSRRYGRVVGRGIDGDVDRWMSEDEIDRWMGLDHFNEGLRRRPHPER